MTLGRTVETLHRLAHRQWAESGPEIGLSYSEFEYLRAIKDHLLRYLVGAPIEQVATMAMESPCKDSLMIQLQFADGSIGTLSYLANGSRSFPKERLELFCGGSILQLDNFRRLRGHGWPGFKSHRLWRQDKGQKQCAQAFVDAIATGDASGLIPFEELVEVAEVCFEIQAQIG